MRASFSSSSVRSLSWQSHRVTRRTPPVSTGFQPVPPHAGQSFLAMENPDQDSKSDGSNCGAKITQDKRGGRSDANAPEFIAPFCPARVPPGGDERGSTAAERPAPLHSACAGCPPYSVRKFLCARTRRKPASLFASHPCARAC